MKLPFKVCQLDMGHAVATGTHGWRIIKRPHSLPSLRACFWPMSNDYSGAFFGMINGGSSHAIVVAFELVFIHAMVVG